MMKLCAAALTQNNFCETLAVTEWPSSLIFMKTY